MKQTLDELFLLVSSHIIQTFIKRQTSTDILKTHMIKEFYEDINFDKLEDEEKGRYHNLGYLISKLNILKTSFSKDDLRSSKTNKIDIKEIILKNNFRAINLLKNELVATKRFINER